MSKHIGRNQRWTREAPNRYASDLGRVVYEQQAWFAVLSYQTRALQAHPEAFPTWVAHTRRLGPFKRPRNAMVALEREATLLKNRHGRDVLLNGQLWAEAERTRGS
jgi:hypothetical protein